jgi:hypothetical protein
MKASILLALVGLSMSSAQVADKVVALACEGAKRMNYYDDDQPGVPSKMSLEVNFTARTVAGFKNYPDILYDFPLAITAVDETTVRFRGSEISGNEETVIQGAINRMSGDAEVAISLGHAKRIYGRPLIFSHSLKCKQMQRMF